MNRRISLVPLGEVQPWILDHLAAGLRDAFGREVAAGPPRSLPREAFNPRRDQFNSSIILTRLTRDTSIAVEGHVLAVTEVDLFTPRLNFVFGEAQLGGRVGVISLARLHADHGAAAAGRDLFLRRALTEAVHELGHVRGLGHCPDPGCVMRFSTDLADTDRKSPAFCPRCARKLAGRA